MYSNYEELTLPIENDGKYKIGDIYYTNSMDYRIRKFDGLKIIDIFYRFGLVLKFEYKDWFENNPVSYLPEKTYQLPIKYHF
jgi:hypothetical protein